MKLEDFKSGIYLHYKKGDLYEADQDDGDFIKDFRIEVNPFGDK